MITAKVESQVAMARFGPSGIPESVRKSLRVIIPDLTKRLGAQVEANLNTGLKTRRRLQVKKEKIESRSALYGRVTTISTSEPMMLPLWLEEGTRAHAIEARNAKALFFFWDKMGKNVAFKRVMHPGFPGIHYTGNALESMRSEIINAITLATGKALNG